MKASLSNLTPKCYLEQGQGKKGSLRLIIRKSVDDTIAMVLPQSLHEGHFSSETRREDGLNLQQEGLT